MCETQLWLAGLGGAASLRPQVALWGPGPNSPPWLKSWAGTEPERSGGRARLMLNQVNQRKAARLMLNRVTY